MTRQNTIISIGLVLAFVVGLFTGGQSFRSRPMQPPREIVQNQTPPSASVMLDFEDGVVQSYNDIDAPTGTTAFQLLQRTLATAHLELGSKEYSGLGTLVTKIGSKENGTDQRYWQYWVNNRHAQVGASSYAVQPGDVIEWKFVPEQGE